MRKLKTMLVAMVTVVVIGAVGASAASGATGRVDVNGGSGCDYATVSAVSPPTTIGSGDIFTTSCDIFGTDADINGAIDVTQPSSSELQLAPNGSFIEFDVKLFGFSLCKVTITSSNHVSMTGSSPTYAAAIPVTATPTPPANATDNGGSGCPAKPYDINMDITLP